MIIQADTTRGIPLADESVQCVVTSPPYWGLRDYGVNGQLGLEKTPEEYVSKLVAVFREVRRVLRKDGTVWLNLGDSYATSPAGNFGKDMPAPADGGRYRENKPKMDWRSCNIKPKDLVGIPWRVAFALQADGWWLRQDIIWHKPNPMPESVTDRCTKSHEYIFLLSKSASYYYDQEAIKERCNEKNIDRRRGTDSKVGINEEGYLRTRSGLKNGNGRVYQMRNARSVWEIPMEDRVDRIQKKESYEDLGEVKKGTSGTVWKISTQPYPEAHFATFPEALVEPCILAGCPVGGIVLDPFCGSGTTIRVANRLQREGVGIDLKLDYLNLAKTRISNNQVEMTFA